MSATLTNDLFKNIHQSAHTLQSLYSLMLSRNGKVNRIDQMGNNAYAVVVEHDLILMEMDRKRNVLSTQCLGRITSTVLLEG